MILNFLVIYWKNLYEFLFGLYEFFYKFFILIFWLFNNRLRGFIMFYKIMWLLEVIEVIGLLCSIIYLCMNKGSFLFFIFLGERVVGWLYIDIVYWFDVCVVELKVCSYD